MKFDLEKELSDVEMRLSMATVNAEKMRAALPKIIPHLDGAKWAFFYENAQIIAVFETRADFAPIRALAHKWAKGEPSLYDAQRYNADVFGVDFTAKVGELSPTCKIVEEEIELPEQIIPARKEIRRKIVCKETSNAES